MEKLPATLRSWTAWGSVVANKGENHIVGDEERRKAKYYHKICFGKRQVDASAPKISARFPEPSKPIAVKIKPAIIPALIEVANTDSAFCSLALRL